MARDAKVPAGAHAGQVNRLPLTGPDSRPLLQLFLIGAMGHAVLLSAMFFDALFLSGNRLLGSVGTDLATQFLFWRDFGFRELRNGHIPLWNPHIFGGAPYFGGMQAALLYPPNWLFLVLPLVAAVNWTVFANAWMLGTFMFAWGLRRGLHPLAAFMAGALLVFGTSHFLHIYAGHLTNLAAMAWTPLLFLVIDEWFRSRRPLWSLAGMFVVAMQLLAGHPQYVFYTAIAAGGYSLIRLLTERQDVARTALGLLAIHPGGALLAGAQLLAGIQATQETIRGKSLPFRFVAEFDFPPENVLTTIAPGFFGNVQFYWGKGHLWEASLFIGVIGLCLALYGMRKGQTPGKIALLAMIPITLLLALGDNTPLLRFLYEQVPGFDRFRAISKFVFQTSVLLALFAAIGMDRLMRNRVVQARAIWTLAGAAALFVVAANIMPRLEWKMWMLGLWSSGKVMRPLSMYENQMLVTQAQQFSALALWITAGTLTALALLLWWLRSQPRAVLCIAAMAMAEVFIVARLNYATFQLSEVIVPYFGHPSDNSAFRVLNRSNPNAALTSGQFEVWGDDPGVARRYAELIFWIQGLDPDVATQYIGFWRMERLLSMVRLRYATRWAEDRTVVFEVKEPPLPRLLLLALHRVVSQRDEIFEVMAGKAFDPRREVILESEPEPRPIPATFPGETKIIREGTDFMEIEADVKSPSILLVTDAWTPSWQAKPLPGSNQERYEVMPANYALRGIPLGAGKHRLRLEYAPSAYRTGWWVSAVAWLAWIAACIFAARSNRRAMTAHA